MFFNACGKLTFFYFFIWPFDFSRHCLWILGNERTLTSSPSIWGAIVSDAKDRGCFYNADDDKDLAKVILEVKKELDQFDDLLNADSVLFKNSKWEVTFTSKMLLYS